MGLLHQIMKHNFIPSLLILASGVMALHYSTIIQLFECPTTIAHTGKSTTMNVVLSIMGMLLSFSKPAVAPESGEQSAFHELNGTFKCLLVLVGY